MGFETYMNEQIPTWKTDISFDVIEVLKKKFDKVQMWQQSLNTINNNMKNHNKSGIDYSTDFQKAGNDFARYTGMLDELLNEVKETLGMEVVERKSSVK